MENAILADEKPAGAQQIYTTPAVVNQEYQGRPLEVCQST